MYYENIELFEYTRESLFFDWQSYTSINCKPNRRKLNPNVVNKRFEYCDKCKRHFPTRQHRHSAVFTRLTNIIRNKKRRQRAEYLFYQFHQWLSRANLKIQIIWFKTWPAKNSRATVLVRYFGVESSWYWERTTQSHSVMYSEQRAEIA